MHIPDMIARWRLARRETLPYLARVSYRFGCAEKDHVMEETFRLDLNQSWEAIDIRTGHAVLIPKGSHQAIRMLFKGQRDQTEENYLVVTVQHEGNPVLAGLREAYWRHWEGHHIRELRVAIREMKKK